MRCHDVKIELQAYVDGDLSPERAALLEQHLAGCDGCRAELARLEAVVAALETWPLVAEPAHLADRVMTQVGQHFTLPAFRLRWSDLVISMAGAGLVFMAILVWRYLASVELVQLYCPRVYLRLEMLRLEVLLMTQRLAKTSDAAWGLVLVGVTLATALAVAVWGQVTLYPLNGWLRIITTNTAKS